MSQQITDSQTVEGILLRSLYTTRRWIADQSDRRFTIAGYEAIRRADVSVESLSTPGGWDAIRIVRWILRAGEL